MFDAKGKIWRTAFNHPSPKKSPYNEAVILPVGSLGAEEAALVGVSVEGVEHAGVGAAAHGLAVLGQIAYGQLNYSRKGGSVNFNPLNVLM